MYVPVIVHLVSKQKTFSIASLSSTTLDLQKYFEFTNYFGVGKQKIFFIFVLYSRAEHTYNLGQTNRHHST
jgi:hypothetical protein